MVCTAVGVCVIVCVHENLKVITVALKENASHPIFLSFFPPAVTSSRDNRFLTFCVKLSYC